MAGASKVRVDSAALKKVPLFADLGEAELRTLVEGVEEKRFGAGEILVKEGTIGSEVFLIVSGACEVRRAQEGKEWVVARLGPGQIFGEMAVIDPDKRSATVIATEGVVTYVLSGFEFRAAIQAHPSIAIQVMKVLAARLR